MRRFLFFTGKNLPVWLLLVFCIGIIQSVHGAEERFISREQGSDIHSGLMLTTQDDKFIYMLQNPTAANAWTTAFDMHTLDNMITLSIDPYSKEMLNTQFTITVELQVSYDVWDYGSGVFKNKILPDNITLKVTNEDIVTAAQKYKSVYRFQGGNRLRVTVVNITSSIAIPAALTLESEIVVERYYRMNTSAMISLIEDKSTFVNSRGELEVSWAYLQGAEEYEIEWTHVDNYRTEQNANYTKPNTTKDASMISFSVVDFNSNATRITTTNNYYRIPLLYEQGFILYRIRAVGRNRTTGFTKNSYTRWSDEPADYEKVSQFPNKFEILETMQLNKDLNWQSSVSFAEEGKNKASVSYFDGSLRNRQTVTKMNTKDEVIAGETIYDEQGRPMIQVLPAPVNDAKPSYKPGLNLNSIGQIYGPSDVIKDVNSGCYGASSPMSTTAGSSQYYSASNPDKTNENQYIPDAEGYPFTQTIYTPDNTGRITAQSGVGATHRIGNGKETNYFYAGPPNSTDINRLFGSEVGKVKHYKKNLVVDANGQVSISYLDAQGRVIATALAGDSPEQVDELPSSSVVTKTKNMLESRSNETDKVEGNKKTFTSTFSVSTKDDWIVDYSIQSKKFSEQCVDLGLGEITKCYECVLDLQLLLTDQCGHQYFVHLPGFDSNYNTAQVGELIAQSISSGNCTPLLSEPVTFNNYATASLPVGSYTLTRVLSVNEQALDTYLQDYISSSDCIIKLEDFIQEETALNVSGRCNTGCTECLEELGTYDQYNIALNPDCDVCMTPEEYKQRLQTCKDICEPAAADCAMLESSMLSDMTLFGQYSTVSLEIEDDPATLANETQKYYVYNLDDLDLFPLSIFNEGNKLPRKKWFTNAGPGGTAIAPNWRYPYRKKADGTVINYYENENEERAYVKINKIAGIYLPEVVNNQKVYAMLSNGNEINYYTDPENLKDVGVFIANWDDSWAKSLLIYHPEYCYLEYCQANSSSYDFDDRWYSTEQVAQAPVGPKGPYSYLDPVGILNDNIMSMNSWTEAFSEDDANTRLDPFMNPSTNPSYNVNDFTSMKSRMLRYVQKHEGVTSGSADSEFYNIWQAAYLSVLCPNYEEVPGVNSSCDKSSCALILNSPELLMDIITHNDKVWKAYSSMYYSIKREIVENRATQYAIKRGCYNGCMGTQAFDVNADGFMAALYKETKMETYSVPYAQYFWQQYQRLASTNSLLFRYLTAVNFFKNRFPKTYTRQVEYFQSQYYNPEQPCNSENYKLYADADKAYIRNKDGLQSGAGVSTPNTCTPIPISSATYSVDPTELEAITGPVCPEANQEITKAASNKAAFELYQQCGQCPATKMLETFFDEVASLAKINMLGLAATDLQVNCVQDGLASFSSDLEEKFLYSKGTGGQRQVGNIIWNASFPDANTLSVNLTKTVSGVPQTAQIVLVKKPTYNFTDLNTGVVHSFSFDWNDILGMCCFEATDVMSILSPGVGMNGYKFRGKGRVELSFDDNNTVLSDKIIIEGYTNKVNLTCDAPVLCETLPIATELSNLWNALVYSSEQFQGVDGNGNPDVIVPAVSSKFTSANFLIDSDISTYTSGNLPYEGSVSISLLSALPAIATLPVLPPNGTAPAISAWWKMTNASVASNKKTFLLVLLNSDGSVLGQYPFEFEIESADYEVGLDFNAIKRFVQVKADKNSPDPSRYFTAKALVSGAYGMKYINLKGRSPSIPIGQCKTAIKAIGASGTGNGQ